MRALFSPALREAAGLFLRLGFTAFGGPAAHVLLMHSEVVTWRKWLTDQEFLDLLGATNLIPRPSSTEMAIRLGFRRAGWPALAGGGVCFVLPAMLIVLALAWAYVRFGALPETGSLLLMIARNLGRLLERTAAAAAAPFSLPLLFFTFLKTGAVTYGSGYVLLAFLRADRVVRYGWLTDQQLLDAIAIGQVTPGPLFTTATFIGYTLGGAPAALLATLGIFLPSFVFVALSNPFIPRMRRSPWLGGLLDGVNANALGLMAAVTWQIGHASLVDPLTVIVALTSLVLLLRLRVSSTWLIVGGAAVGLLHCLLP